MKNSSVAILCVLLCGLLSAEQVSYLNTPVSGQVAPYSAVRIETVSLNGVLGCASRKIILSDKNGRYQAAVPSFPGSNIIRVDCNGVSKSHTIEKFFATSYLSTELCWGRNGAADYDLHINDINFRFKTNYWGYLDKDVKFGSGDCREKIISPGLPAGIYEIGVHCYAANYTDSWPYAWDVWLSAGAVGQFFKPVRSKVRSGESFWRLCVLAVNAEDEAVLYGVDLNKRRVVSRIAQISLPGVLYNFMTDNGLRDSMESDINDSRHRLKNFRMTGPSENGTEILFPGQSAQFKLLADYSIDAENVQCGREVYAGFFVTSPDSEDDGAYIDTFGVLSVTKTGRYRVRGPVAAGECPDENMSRDTSFCDVLVLPRPKLALDFDHNGTISDQEIDRAEVMYAGWLEANQCEDLEYDPHCTSTLLLVNDDDDNGNNLADYCDLDPVENENDLLVFSIPLEQTGYPVEVKLSASSLDGGEIRIWTDSQKEASQITLPKTWNLADGALSNSLFYIEGLVSGTVALKLEYSGLAGVEMNREYILNVAKIDMIPDWNHDRKINDQDKNKATSVEPFRFWINDDNDNGDISEGDSDVPGQGGWFSSANYEDDLVNGRSDLSDFFPVWLDLSTALNILPPNRTVQYRLKQADDALKFVYTDLPRDFAGDYLIRDIGYCGPDFNQNVNVADTIQITAEGVALSTDFLNRIIANTNKGVLLMEATKASTAPLVLELWQNDCKVWETSLALSLSGVEDMYYKWINLRHVTGGSEDRPTDTRAQISNYSDDLKHLVFVHGFNVSEKQARGWNAEMFKRLYWSGSRALFTAVIWQGDESGVVDPLYQKNVNNAFLTAPYLAQSVNTFDGEKNVMAHSLGNMVVSSAIQDDSLNVSSYSMLGAAVATECYDPGTFNAATNNNPMLHVDWRSYQPKTWASKWHELFSAPDCRAKLTWQNRFPAILPKAYNFYSSEDEVFEIYTNVLDVLTGVDLDFTFAFLDDTEHYSWHKQEMFKGLNGSLVHSLGATDWAGWGFNNNILGFRVYSSGEANVVSNEVLIAEPVFRKNPDDIFSASIDSSIVNEVLAKGVPVLSYATGVTNLFSLPASRNYNMVSEKPVLWPRDHETYGKRWLHSDIKDVAYPYVYRTFGQIVEKGKLQ